MIRLKTLEELLHTPRLQVMQSGDDGGYGLAYLASNRRNTFPALVIFSWGNGWDHVSVSYSNRTPTWDEMCEIKDMFFNPDEAAVEYHPAEEQYVNNHPHCLHIWKPQGCTLPTPPTWMVGARKGQTWQGALQEAKEAMCNGHEQS